MNTLFDEAAADAFVGEVLRKNKKLRSTGMNFIKDENGKVVRIVESAEVTREELVDNVGKAKELLATAEARLAEYDSLTDQPSEAAQPETPAEPKPEEVGPKTEALETAPVEQPADPEPKPTEALDTVQPEQPAEQPAIVIQ